MVQQFCFVFFFFNLLYLNLFFDDLFHFHIETLYHINAINFCQKFWMKCNNHWCHNKNTFWILLKWIKCRFICLIWQQLVSSKILQKNWLITSKTEKSFSLSVFTKDYDFKLLKNSVCLIKLNHRSFFLMFVAYYRIAVTKIK